MGPGSGRGSGGSRQAGLFPSPGGTASGGPAVRSRVLAWTDGGCRGNPGPGGWGFLLVDLDGGGAVARRGGEGDTTNNRMELTAAIEALRALASPSDIEIRTDSRLLVDTCSKWIAGWKRRGWKRKEGPVKNLDLVQELDMLMTRHRVTWTWVEGHAGIRGNEFVDGLTNIAMDAVQRGENPAAERKYDKSPVRP